MSCTTRGGTKLIASRSVFNSFSYLASKPGGRKDREVGRDEKDGESKGGKLRVAEYSSADFPLSVWTGE